MAQFSNDKLIEQVKRKVFMPANQNTFSPEEILEIAYDEIVNEILPAVTSVREEYFVNTHRVELDGSNNIDTAFPIPSRAVGMALREVSVVQANIERNLARRDLEDKSYTTGTGQSYSFRIENNDIYLFGSQTGTLKMYYNLRPSQLITTSKATKVASILGDKSFSVVSIPTSWVIGTKIDIINHKPGFHVKNVSAEITGISGNTITVDQDLDANIAEGDWVALEDESPVPNIPQEFFQYLAQATAVHILESLGDMEAMQAAAQRLDQMKLNALRLISPRVEGQSKKFVARRNRGSYSNSNWRWF